MIINPNLETQLFCSAHPVQINESLIYLIFALSHNCGIIHIVLLPVTQLVVIARFIQVR